MPPQPAGPHVPPRPVGAAGSACPARGTTPAREHGGDTAARSRPLPPAGLRELPEHGESRLWERLEGQREEKPMEEPRTTALPHPGGTVPDSGVDLRTQSPHTQPTRSRARTAAGPGKMRGRSSASPPARSQCGTKQHPEIREPPRIPPPASHLFFESSTKAYRCFPSLSRTAKGLSCSLKLSFTSFTRSRCTYELY